MNKLAKLSLMVVLGTSVSFAQGSLQDKKGQMPKERKAEMLQLLDVRIKNLTSLRSCVSQAQSHPEVKVCRERAQKVREKGKKVVMERKAKRKMNK